MDRQLKQAEEKTSKRMKAMPKRYRSIYQRAFSGKASPREAIKAFCLECVGWQREEIKKCTCSACPLYAYRPYQSSSGSPREPP